MPQTLPEMLLLGRRSRGGDRQPEQRPRKTRRANAVALAGIPLFAGLSKRHVNHLADAADEVVFAPGEAIVREGDLGETLFVMLEGQAKVMRGGRAVAKLLPGQFFGELSAIDGGPRTASVIADTPVRALRVFRRTLADLLRQEPNVTVRMLEGMARRIREIDVPLNG
jgi:CRP/FNR family transcriptional regulator, cyclic AMP receptor protein